MGTIDDLANRILRDIVADFRAKNLTSDALEEEYVGVSMIALRSKYCEDETYTRVDFDLALKQIEEAKLVKTGPVEPYDNRPDSQVFFAILVSKREFVYLTEKGYRAAQKSATRSKLAAPKVHISGGNFHQSPIGVGNMVNQTLNVNVRNDSEVIEYLGKLLASQSTSFAEEGRREVTHLLATAETGDLRKTKSIFDRLYGGAKETVKQLAWGVITAYISHKLGI